eukprot:10622311-Alexandrium_andersonii.AAC.1
MNSVVGLDSPTPQSRLAPSPQGTGSTTTPRTVLRSEGPARARSAQAALRGAKSDGPRSGGRQAAAPGG